MKDRATAKPTGSLRASMPITAGIVDELRQAFGAARVDAAIAAGVKLQREHALIERTQGRAVADQWLDRQRVPAGAFMSIEAGRKVGAVPLPCTMVVPPLGPSQGVQGRGNSDPDCGLFNGSSKGVI